MRKNDWDKTPSEIVRLRSFDLVSTSQHPLCAACVSDDFNTSTIRVSREHHTHTYLEPK